jgi:hypothetical protein
MAYWIFKCNAELYRLKDRLADPNPRISWAVSRHREEIGPEDTVFVWLTGHRTNRPTAPLVLTISFISHTRPVSSMEDDH